MFGNCINKDAGTSSLLVNVSVNNMKQNLDYLEVNIRPGYQHKTRILTKT